MSESKGTQKKRRRGAELENAILAAAWELLIEVGYEQLTIEGIAEKAGTTKTVLYRRWSRKVDIVIAAFQKMGPKVKTDAPNTGDLRTDLIQLYRNISNPFRILGAETIRGIFADQISTAITKLPQISISEDNGFQKVVATVLQQAEERGEVNLAKLSKRIMALPTSLFINEMLFTQGPIEEKVIVEIVDTILLPLLLKNK